jgi:hypothetical protein
LSKGTEELERRLSKSELEEWLRNRIMNLEEELKYLKALLAIISGEESIEQDPRRVRPGERVEEVRAGRRKIARVFKGEDYVRLAALEPMILPSEVRAYLEDVVSEIRAEQARNGLESELAKLEVRLHNDNSLKEIVIYNLRNALEIIKAKAALKHVAEVAWQYTKATSQRD